MCARKMRGRENANECIFKQTPSDKEMLERCHYRLTPASKRIEQCEIDERSGEEEKRKRITSHR